MATFDIKGFEEKWRQPKKENIDAARAAALEEGKKYIGDATSYERFKDALFDVPDAAVALASGTAETLSEFVLGLAKATWQGAQVATTKDPERVKEILERPGFTSSFDTLNYPRTDIYESQISGITPTDMMEWTGKYVAPVPAGVIAAGARAVPTIAKGIIAARAGQKVAKATRGATGPQGISRIKQAQRIKNKAKLQTFFDNNPEVVQKFKDGDMKIPKMIELADLRNHKGKLVADETFKALFRLTEQGGGKGPQAFVKGHWVGRPKGYMSPEQDTFLLNVVQQRLKEGHSYEGLRSSLQKYIRDNPELLKQAEELKLTGYPDMKLQDRIKRLIEGKEKNLSEANQAIVNTLREAKEAAPKKAEWHTLKESAIKNLSKENQKIALTYADEIINYAEPSLQSAVRKSTYGSLKRMIARAQTKKVGASEAEILEVLKNVDKEAISKIYQKQGTLVNKIKEARELGVTIDDFGDIDLSHIADVANHWKLTMDADNLFFGFKSLNRGDQIKLNNRIDDILSEFPHAKNYAEKRELAKKMIKIRKLLEENDLISVVRGKQIGKKDPTDPTLFEKKTKTLGELMQSQRQSQLIDEYGVKHGGLVGINHLTRPI